LFNRYRISSDKPENATRALALLIATAATTLATPTAATATPITYDLVGASAQNIVGETVQFTGTFTYDPATVTLDSADIVALVPGAVFPPTFGTPQSATQTEIKIEDPASDVLTIDFANPLGPQPDQITTIEITNRELFNPIAGSAVPTAAAVPAPPIGRGLPVLLAVGGLLFGAKLLERSKKLGLQTG
jgi:hypothetical protein